MDGKHAAKGFSLIESAIVLAVVGLVIGGIWWAASEIRYRYNLNRDIALVGQIQLRLSELYRNVRSVYEDGDGQLTTDQMIALGLITKDLKDQDGNARTYTGGYLEVDVDSSRYNSIGVYDFPERQKSTCARLGAVMARLPFPEFRSLKVYGVSILRLYYSSDNLHTITPVPPVNILGGSLSTEKILDALKNESGYMGVSTKSRV